MLSTLLLQGCVLWPFGSDEDVDGTVNEDEDANTTEQILYRDVQRSLRSGNYQVAIGGLERLEARFPFGRYAEQAQLELIYARYMSFKHDDARAAADRFIRLHPQHADVDYAYYLKGLSAYNKNAGLADRLYSSDASKRDITSAREAYADFGQLLARYPESEYAADARQRMLYLRNLLARSELHVADYYMRRGAYVAAANRARYVVENYPQSDAVADALALNVEANWKLDLTIAANDSLRVLATNFPAYPAFDDDGSLVLAEAVRNRDRSWMNLMTFGILDRPDVPPPLKIQQPEDAEPIATRRDAPETDEKQTGKKRGWFSWLPFVG